MGEPRSQGEAMREAVRESVRYRRRGQEAERRAEDLDAQVAALAERAKNAELRASNQESIAAIETQARKQAEAELQRHTREGGVSMECGHPVQCAYVGAEVEGGNGCQMCDLKTDRAALAGRMMALVLKWRGTVLDACAKEVLVALDRKD